MFLRASGSRWLLAAAWSIAACGGPRPPDPPTDPLAASATADAQAPDAAVDAAVDAAPPSWVAPVVELYRRVATEALSARPTALAAAALAAAADEAGAPVPAAGFSTEAAAVATELERALAGLPAAGADDAVVLAVARALATSLGPPAAVAAARSSEPAPPAITHRIVRGLGVVRVREVTGDAMVAELRAALAIFDRKRLRGMVVDLRGAGGDDWPEAAVSLFTNRDVLWHEEDAGGTHHPVSRRGEIWPTERPMAVLVDERTTGAAEALALVLQDLDIGYVVGQPTAGALTRDAVVPLPGGATLRFPARRLVGAVSGAVATKVTPTLQVTGADAQLAAAVADVQRRVRTPRPRPR